MNHLGNTGNEISNHRVDIHCNNGWFIGLTIFNYLDRSSWRQNPINFLQSRLGIIPIPIQNGLLQIKNPTKDSSSIKTLKVEGIAHLAFWNPSCYATNMHIIEFIVIERQLRCQACKAVRAFLSEPKNLGSQISMRPPYATF